MEALLHVAGTPIEGTQRCARCGALVLDLRPRPRKKKPRDKFFRAKIQVVLIGAMAFLRSTLRGQVLPPACEIPEQLPKVYAGDVDFAMMLANVRPAAGVIEAWDAEQRALAIEWAEDEAMGKAPAWPARLGPDLRVAGATVTVLPVSFNKLRGV